VASEGLRVYTVQKDTRSIYDTREGAGLFLTLMFMFYSRLSSPDPGFIRPLLYFLKVTIPSFHYTSFMILK